MLWGKISNFFIIYVFFFNRFLSNSSKVTLNNHYHINLGPCTPNQFECEANWCIEKIHRCDGINDCDNGRDEEGCGKYTIISFYNLYKHMLIRMYYLSLLKNINTEVYIIEYTTPFTSHIATFYLILFTPDSSQIILTDLLVKDFE